jgi:4-hydroxy-2-oxoglutarate aldolase
MKLQGVFVAAATPFDYKGDIYKVKVEHNLAKWNLTAVSGYSFASAAGEGPLLRESEKIALWEMATRFAAPGKILIADCSAEGVAASAYLAKQAAGAGFHAVICGTPHSGETQMLYFRALADRSPLPVIVEGDLTAEVVAAMSQHPNVIGAVVPVAARIPQILASAEAGFSLLAGSSGAFWESLENGASGALLSLASAVPYACITLWEAFRTREREAGVDWQGKIAHPGRIVTEVYGVPALKCAMELNGYYGGPPRLPFCPPTAATRREIEGAFRDLRG